MKKVILMFMLLALTHFLIGCVRTIDKDDLDPLNGDEIIDMNNLDNYMFRGDVQYVDLRNFEDRFATGYIDSFESIPFFDYLDNLVFYRNDTFEFSSEQLLYEDEIYRLFDMEKSIFLYADGCIRSGYLKDVLLHLGYTNIYVLGGYYEYTGQYRVLGDGAYSFGDSFYVKFDYETSDLTYYMSGTTDLSRKIIDIRFDIIDLNGQTLRGDGYSTTIDYNEQLSIIESYILNDTVTMYQLNMELNDHINSPYYNITGLSLNIFEELIELTAETISYTNQ